MLENESETIFLGDKQLEAHALQGYMTQISLFDIHSEAGNYCRSGKRASKVNVGASFMQ